MARKYGSSRFLVNLSISSKEERRVLVDAGEVLGVTITGVFEAIEVVDLIVLDFWISLDVSLPAESDAEISRPGRYGDLVRVGRKAVDELTVFTLGIEAAFSLSFSDTRFVARPRRSRENRISK